MRRHFTASMCVVDPWERNVLLVHHKAMGEWVFPGGHVDDIGGGQMELPHEAAEREVWEETSGAVRAELFVPGGPRELPGQTWLPSPWQTSLNEAPEKLERRGADGKVKPAEEAHQHIDMLYIGTADSLLPLAEAPADEAHGVRWVHFGDLWGLEHLRGEVIDLTGEALALIEQRAGTW